MRNSLPTCFTYKGRWCNSIPRNKMKNYRFELSSIIIITLLLGFILISFAQTESRFFDAPTFKTLDLFQTSISSTTESMKIDYCKLVLQYPVKLSEYVYCRGIFNLIPNE